MNAYLFPGQGSQYVGMLREAYLANAQVRDIVNRADDVLGYLLSGIMFEGPEDELRQTKHAQPAIFLHSFVAYELLDDPAPAMAAGHSLGEYTALTIARALNFDDALLLVKLRGELMQKAGETTPGTMAAIIGLDDDTVDGICREVSETTGPVEPANYNAPGQIVVSGSIGAVSSAMHLAKEAGARLVKGLNVSGAFHSSLMGPAAEPLGAALAEITILPAEFPVYANATAEALTDPAAIRSSLLRQLTSPVLWTDTIRNMCRDGATDFFEMGPGSVLQGLVKRIAPPGTGIRGADNYGQIELLNTTRE